MPDIGIYACVSMTDQDPQRQLDQLRELILDPYDEPEIYAHADFKFSLSHETGIEEL